MSKRVQIPAVLEGISTLKDGGLSLRFHTNEVTNDEKLTVFEFYQQFGWLLFAAEEHQETDTQLEAIRRDTGGKSPSQRLRNVLYVLYQQIGDTSTTFEQFYERRMERFINHVKENIEGEKKL